MIDWITAIVDFDHSEDAIFNGFVLSTDKNEQKVWKTRKASFSEGSYSSKVLIKSYPQSAYVNGFKVNKHGEIVKDIRYRQVYIDGNPLKFLNGHNVYGSNDLLSLNKKFFFRIFKELGFFPNPFELSKVVQGDYLLNRVDCTDYISFKNNFEVDLILNRLISTGTYHHRGNVMNSKGTAYIGKQSTWWAIKFYNKFKELNKHQISHKVNNRDQIKNWVENKLRCELVLRKRELNKLFLRYAKHWNSKTVIDMLKQYVNNEKIHITESSDFSDQEILEMPRKLRATFALWKQGIDTSAVMSRTTWYTHRTELLDYGIDIASKPPTDNIKTMKKVIEIDFSFNNSIPVFDKVQPINRVLDMDALVDNIYPLSVAI